MIVTLSEIQGTCQKALMGCRFPAGLEEDAGRAAAWLEVRGLDGIVALLAALDRWDGAAAPAEIGQRALADGTREVAAGGRSAVLVGGLLIDLAAADALAHPGARRITVSGLTAPHFLLPQADLQRRHGLDFRIGWQTSQASQAPAGPPLGGGLVGAGTGATLYGDWGHGGDTAFEATIECCRSGDADFSADVFGGLPVMAEPAELVSRAKRELGSGLGVADDLWARLWAYAHRALVPATDESRARGAGVVGSDKN